jgi:hypothetical protein
MEATVLWMHSWGSRGRRFKSGRPDWSEPHFRTQKQDCERLMGAQRAPISSMNPPWCGVWEDITPLAGGLPSPPKASSPPRAHLSPGQRSPGSPPAVKAGVGNISRGPRRDQVAALAGAVRQPRCPATSSVLSARSFGRSLPPSTGPGQPSLGPLGLNSSPSLRIKGALPRPRQTFYLCRCHTHMDARKLALHEDAAGCSSHESSHGSQAGPAGSVTVSRARCRAWRPPVLL